MSRGLAVRRWSLLGAALLIGAGLRFWQLGGLALIGDESYYWLWSRHPGWAYLDHPAGVAWLVRLSTALGGQSEAGIRWLNALLGVGCIFLAYRLGKQMLSREAGLLAAVLLAVGAPYVLTARFVYTDVLQLCLLLFNLTWFWRLGEDEPEPRRATALIFGVSLALLFNTKYSAYLYAVALVVAVLIDRRRLLSQPRFWLGVAIGALGLLPAIAWNASHGWASFRWQLSHLALDLGGDYSLLGNLRHDLAYLSWPLVVLGLAGLGRLRNPAERLLSLAALVLLLPVALSPADSPRNLSSGLVLLLLLAGTRWPAAPRQRWQTWIAGLLALAVVATAIYGLGTAIGLLGSPAGPPTVSEAVPRSSAVPSIRQDAAGWRALGPSLAASPVPIFALDYSIASQIWYYSGRPAYTSWPQYRLWGIPDLTDATVVSLGYLPEDLVSSRLSAAFQQVEEPQRFRFAEGESVKEVRVWHAAGLRLDQETFLQQFDFLNLLAASR